MNCKELIHPLQNDPGVSQRQRVMDDLLSSSAKIDARNLADMLDYFQKLAQHIKFYDSRLNISDWQQFFQNNHPFLVTAILKYNKSTVNDKLNFYSKLFDKNPSEESLQLMISYIFLTILKPIYQWNLKLKGSELPILFAIEKLIKDKLSDLIKEFIVLQNSATKWFNSKPYNVKVYLDEPLWNLDITDLYAIKTNSSYLSSGSNKRNRIIALKGELILLAETFLDAIVSLAPSAESSLEPSFDAINEEFKEKLSPHIALLFSFLKLFKHLQDDLNTFTKKHLDFFYKDVLNLKAKEAEPDKIHLVFQLQNQVDKYLLEKGLLVKGPKDLNKTEIQFTLDNQIVVNKAQVVEKRTFYLNNKIFNDSIYLEGLYIAPNAIMADGIDKPFSDDFLPSWPTLGAYNSKYIDPENQFVKPYPHARLGFVLASPVLLLNEGIRKISIVIKCTFNNEICDNVENSVEFTENVVNVLNQVYYPINRDLIQLAIKKGISKHLEQKLKSILIQENADTKNSLCYSSNEEFIYEKILSDHEYKALIQSKNDIEILSDIIKPIKAFNIAFSGEKEWIKPNMSPEISMISKTASTGQKYYILKISALISAEQESITFYKDEVLKGGFITNLPLVKIEIDDRIKLEKDFTWANLSECEKPLKDRIQQISLYHFFRSLKLSNPIENAADVDDTQIKVEVSGLKNIIVQNSESLQNVNAPIYPFGTRPEIIDFDIKNLPVLGSNNQMNLIGPDFYIGSQEVFGKKWNKIFIKLNWKDKPTDFEAYYKAYLKSNGKFGLDADRFFINLAVLEDGKWVPEEYIDSTLSTKVKIQGKEYSDRKLFQSNGNSVLDPDGDFVQVIHISNNNFDLNQKFELSDESLEQYEVDSKNGFLKLNLQFQDFCHKVYSYVLARQMMALGKLPDSTLEGAIYYNGANELIVFDTSEFKTDIEKAKETSEIVEVAVNGNPDGIKHKIGYIGDGPINDPEADHIRATVLPPDFLHINNKNLSGRVVELRTKIGDILSSISNSGLFQAVIPNEPWTPTIKNIELDYEATATINDIEIIHLYPFQETYKKEQILQEPSLLPTFCEEGSLFLGLKDLIPGTNLNILFQLAEATADSESKRQQIQWKYLDNNHWKSLRNGFEILQDDTDGLTTSGIINFSIPQNITKENTIMPKGLYWIKASISINSKSVSETIGIHTQAVKATFTNTSINDKNRLDKPLTAGSVSKLLVADSSIKLVNQPYDSFEGRIPEADGHFYVRVSETLKHKGRAVQKFDYERIVLEEFPQLFKAKCINHSFALDARQYINDIPIAPGYVVMAVIPDLNKLKAAQAFQPRVPVSLLSNIQDFIKERCSPFVKFRVMNPRYEGVNFCIKVKLQKGRDVVFFKEKLKQDLREFLAPWAVGKYDKLTFGQCIYQSDIIGFLESMEYIDYILELFMLHEDDHKQILYNTDKVICPISPRSILIAASIDVLIEQEDCEQWESPKRYEPCSNPSIPIENYCKKYES